MARLLREGRQAYVVCPLIEQSETSRARAAEHEADRLRRVAAVSRAVPHNGFTETLTLMLGTTPIEIWHRPGPTAGASWVVFPTRRVVFVGDAVCLREPPYLGDAELEPWLAGLHELRGAFFRRYRIVSSRDGVVRKDSLAVMAAWLRRVDGRLQRMGERGDAAEATARFAQQIGKAYRVPAARKEQVAQRLHTGLEALYTRHYLAAE
jgi:glyoxylase-like metal-dependent hydrolase (beta-lactamase superfamily II)